MVGKLRRNMWSRVLSLSISLNQFALYFSCSDTLRLPRTLYFKALFGTWNTILGALDGPWTALWRLMVPLSRQGAALSQSGWKECSIWDIIGTPFRPQVRQKVIRKLKNMPPKNKQTRNWFQTHPQVAQSGSNTINTTCFKGSNQIHLSGFGVTLRLWLGLVWGQFSWFVG